MSRSQKAILRFQVVGVVRDAPYQRHAGAILPVAYVPFHSVNEKGAPQPVGSATFMVRTSGANPMALASILRREVPRARPEFRVSNIRTQREIDDSHTVRERLLAMLALFFAMVALLLAGVGLYGVLDYSVLQRRREIGIRMAIGAPAADIARRVTADIFAVVLLGALAGLALGMASVRYIDALLYQVKPSGPGALAIPACYHSGGRHAGRHAGRGPRGADRPGRRTARRLGRAHGFRLFPDIAACAAARRNAGELRIRVENPLLWYREVRT